MVSTKARTIAIIPARYASTRLPAKPLLDLCGKPMIQHVYERASRARLVDKVIVATDDDRIAEAVRLFGGEVMLTPPDIRSGSDRVAFVAQRLTNADIAVNIQGDEPLIAPEPIDEAIKPLLNDAAIPVGTLVKKITSAEELLNPGVVKVVLDQNGFAIYFSRSPIPHLRDGTPVSEWHREHTYFKHIGLYVYRRAFLEQFARWEESALERVEKLEQLRIVEHGYRIQAVVTEYDSIPVDTSDDIDRVRKLMQQQQSLATR